MAKTRRQLGADPALSMRMLATMLLLAALYSAFVWVLWQVGAGMVTIIFFVAVMVGIQYFLSDHLVLASMRARIVTPNEEPGLHATLARLAAVADMPIPRLAIIESDVPNAFATGRSPSHSAVAVTRGLIRRLSPAELEAVLAHELSHIKHRDVAVMTFASFFATVASLIVQNMFYVRRYPVRMGGRRGRSDRDAGGLMIVWLAAFVVWVVSYFLIRALSRYREFAADRGAAIITGSPANLMSALLAISGAMERIPMEDMREVSGLNAFLIVPALRRESLAELFSTHPSLERRLENLQRIEQEMRS
ncbi:MAG: zinc metalloprotease HtpX [Firmicutes bacterium]|jgi:heat shock protein HtpX|nr:zinc metalloprotease HtpX [Bacillota bacterium]